LLVAVNLVSNDSPDFLLGKTCVIGVIRFLEWLKLFCSGLEPVIVSFGVKVQGTAVVVKSPQR